MMFNIGDKVSEKGKRRVFEIINKIDDTLVLQELESAELNILTLKESQVEPYIEVKKTNKIKRHNTGSVIEYEIFDKEIEFNITEYPMVLSTALKILLHETKLYDYKYKRVSPFKLNREYDSDIQSHVFTIDFIDIHTYKKQENILLTTDRSLRLEGRYSIFIPDFLEICVERGLLERVGDGYRPQKIDDALDNCEYLKTKPSINQLQKEGYIIPDLYSLCV